MIPRPPRSTPTDTRFPCPTLFRSQPSRAGAGGLDAGGLLRAAGRRRPQAPLPGDEVRLAAARDAVVDGLRDPLRHRLRLPGLHGRQPGALAGRPSRLSATLSIFFSEFLSTSKEHGRESCRERECPYLSV